MDTWIKLNGQTAGKDKLIRLIQYASRFLWYHLEKCKNTRDVVIRLKIIENALSSFRKLLRFGKSVEVLCGTLKMLHISDQILRLSVVFSRIYQTCYLLVDHIIWIGRAGLCDIQKEKWSNCANRFWLGSLITNIVRDFYDISRILKTDENQKRSLQCIYKQLPDTQNKYANYAAIQYVLEFASNHRDVFLDTVKNLCDIWIPLASLGHVKMSPGMVGLLGSVSSVAGIITVLDPLAKLSPT